MPTVLEVERAALPEPLGPAPPLNAARTGPAMSIHRAFEATAREFPDRLAVEDAARRLSYRELNAEANRLARELVARGVRPGDTVAVCLERSAAVPISFLAALKAGAAFVPLDPTFPHARRAYKLRDCAARLIVSTRSMLDTLPAHEAPDLCLDLEGETIGRQPDGDLAMDVPADALAYVLYTSGSTGHPKGVMIPHRGVLAHARALHRLAAHRPEDRVLQFSNIAFDVIIEELFPTLLAGAAVVVPATPLALAARPFLEFVDRQRVTVLDLPTAFWHELVLGMDTLDLAMPPSVRLVLIGGEKASRHAWRRWHARVGHVPRFINTYGPTEATVICTAFDPAAEGWNEPHAELPIGRGLDGVHCRVVGADGRPVGVGAIGELVVGGEQVALGYLNLPERTSQRFVPDPAALVAGHRFYRTGDLVRERPDGMLEFLGRVDHQVKIDGYRIELNEIEAALDEHPGVLQSVVLAREDAPGERRLVAYVQARPGSSITVSELRVHLETRLPAYMRPVAWTMLAAFPMTPSGKIDRLALPPPADGSGGPSSIAPRDALEAEILREWQAAFGGRRIGLRDHFVEIGGTSLLAARLATRLEKALGREVAPVLLFQAPTVEQLADALRAPASGAPASSLVVIQPGEAGRAPLVCVHVLGTGYGFFRPMLRHLPPRTPVYGVSVQLLAAGDRPDNTVEAIAQRYVRDIAALDHRGPVHLLGFSFGGDVAYEVARQLRERGFAVGLLGLLDTYAPAEQASLGPAQRLVVHLRRLRRHGWSHLRRVVGWRVIDALGHLDGWVSRWRRGRRERTGRPLTDHLAGDAFMHENDVAMAAYHHPPYGGRVTLFRARDEMIDFYRAEYVNAGMGWAALAREVEVIEVPGSHTTMVQEPAVATLGARVAERLAATEGGSLSD